MAIWILDAISMLVQENDNIKSSILVLALALTRFNFVPSYY